MGDLLSEKTTTITPPSSSSFPPATLNFITSDPSSEETTTPPSSTSSSIPPPTLTLTLPILPSRPVTPRLPPQTQTVTATHLVFHLPELLELILLHLTPKDLLLTQRTARCFRHTTLSSPALQKALFLQPDWNLEGRAFNAYAPHNRPGRKPENNTLLLRAFSACYYPTVTLRIDNDEWEAEQGSGAGASAKGGSEHWSWDVCISFPTSHPPTTSPSVLFPEASWRRMFLSQPPCTSLHLVRRWQRSLHPAIVREGGIKMGEFVDEATREGGGWSMGFVSSDRDWHFEGNIRCSRVVVGEDGDLEKTKAEEFTARLREYLFNRSEVRVER